MYRKIGEINRQAIQQAFENVKQGWTLRDIDAFLLKYVSDRGMKPAFKGYNGFPGNACIAVNDVIVHGVPTDYVIKNGDLLTIDFGTIFDGHYTDAAETRVIGEYLNNEDKLLIEGSVKVLNDTVDAVKPGISVYELAQVTMKSADSVGLNIFGSFAGHGIGRKLHEFPSIIHKMNSHMALGDVRLEEGTMICVEPVVTFGSTKHKKDSDQWTIRSEDGSKSAHQERMILITETGSVTIS